MDVNVHVHRKFAANLQKPQRLFLYLPDCHSSSDHAPTITNDTSVF